jgi:uncharacterized membrane protein YkvA (DUF1232 family)
MGAFDFYTRLRQAIAGYSGPNAEYILLAPDLVVLLGRLMMDKRVELRHKAYLGAALAYVIAPVDILPERLVGAPGYIDDVAVMVAVLNVLLNETDEQVLLDHWSGSADLLATVRRFLGQADQIIGVGRLQQILEALGIRQPAPPAA